MSNKVTLPGDYQLTVNHFYFSFFLLILQDGDFVKISVMVII